MLKKNITDKPKNLQENYLDIYKNDCEVGDSNDFCYSSFFGRGIDKKNHPLKDSIKFKNCCNCKSSNVLIIYAHYHIHKHSGDENWSYELYCSDCGKFTNVFFRDI